MISGKALKSAGVLLISAFTLWLGFVENKWRVAEPTWFTFHQIEGESLVMGRLVKSRRDGILSSGGLTGRIGPIPEGRNRHTYQYTVFYKDYDFETYGPYKSQIGLQAMCFRLLDRIMGLHPRRTVRVLKSFNSALSALALSVVILWIYRELGLAAASLVLITTVFSPWVTVFGRNLWWVLWAFYLPLLGSLLILRRRKRPCYLIALITFLSVFLKCLLNGYEYISTTLLMMLTPYVYFAFLERWRLRDFLNKTLVAGSAAVIGVLSSVMILVFQLSTFTGGFRAGLYHIFVYTLGKRTHGDAAHYPEALADSLNAGTLGVIRPYLVGTVFDLNGLFGTSTAWFEVSYLGVIAVLLALSLFLFLSGRFPERVAFRGLARSKRKTTALCAAAWFSLTAPLSWFIIFKAHSYVHTHINFITWHMPFVLLVFALLGLMAYQVVLGKTPGPANAEHTPERNNADPAR